MKLKLMVVMIFPLFALSQTNYSPTNFILKTSLLSPIDAFSFPTINLSVEQRIGRNVSLQGEFGYQFYWFRKVDTTFVTPHGFKSNIECRFYHLFNLFKTPENSLRGSYLGINAFYRANESDVQLIYYPGKTGSSKKDCLWSSKNNWGMNLVFGIQQNIGTRVYVDGYLGLGIMNRTSVNYNREYNHVTDSLSRPVDFSVGEVIDNSNLSENSGWRFNLNFGIRAGIKI